MLEQSSAHAPASLALFAAVASDQEVMTRFADGDRDAFAELYERHGEAVLRVCTRMLGTRAAAADVAHDTFVTAFERRHQWRPQPGPHAVRAWFTTIATRKCLDLVRRASSRRERADGRTHDQPVQPSLPDHRCRTILCRAVAALPPEQQEVVRLKIEQGLTYREISQQTGVPEPALKSRFRLARAKLSRHLDAAGVTRDQLLS